MVKIIPNTGAASLVVMVIVKFGGPQSNGFKYALMNVESKEIIFMVLRSQK